MKPLLTFEQFINEKESTLDSETLGLLKRGDVIHIADVAVTVDEIISKVNGVVTKFIGWSNDGKRLMVQFDYANNQYVLDEFEGSSDPATQMTSDLFLATQTAANGIAF